MALAKAGQVRALDLTALKIPRSGLRPESLEYLKRGGKAYGGPPNIGVQPDGSIIIYDGRHRMLIARESGKPIEIVVRYYGPRGGLLRTERRMAKL